MSMEKHKDFCVFILTHGRPDKVITLRTLRASGYSGPVFIVIDDEDAFRSRYEENFGGSVIVFDKKVVADSIDEFSNFDNRKAIVYARNACFDIAENLAFEYFLELDDDYVSFKYRMNDKFEQPESCPKIKRTLDGVFSAVLDFYKSATQISTIAFSQGGDWMGGKPGFSKRKAMNSFFCSTLRRFVFAGGTNEDVGTYTSLGSRGVLFLTIPVIQLDQLTTQKNKGGMSETYLSQGTYVKSFYTVLCSPSSVAISLIGSKARRRLHHKINWPCAVPQIIQERYRK